MGMGMRGEVSLTRRVHASMGSRDLWPYHSGLCSEFRSLATVLPPPLFSVSPRPPRVWPQLTTFTRDGKPLQAFLSPSIHSNHLQHAEDQNMEDVMDAPMDIGTSSHQLPPPLHQTFNTQHPSTNANTGGYWPASPARICLHGCLGCASSDRNGPPLRTNADSCGQCPPRPRSLPRHPSQGPH